MARIIEGTDVSVFRSIVTLLTPLIGLKDAEYCDGPYDGGKDFNLATMPVNNVKIGIQISVEKDWQSKIKRDAAKLKTNYSCDVMYYISSKRIPELTFETIREEIFCDLGVTVSKYDNQAIATRLISHNKVKDALILMGLDISDPEGSQSKYLGPKYEAVSSLLLFDADSKDLRMRFFQSIIMSTLSRERDGESRISLIDKVKENFNIDASQLVQIGSNIDRLLQSGEIISSKGKVLLSDKVQKRYEGLKASTNLELESLKEDFDKKITEIFGDKLDEKTKKILLDNFLDLVVYLSGKKYNTYEISNNDNFAFQTIQEIINSKLGREKSTAVFKELSDFFASSDFCKHIACAKLYEAFLNTKSSHLINALGGTEDLNIYIDSSVFIPVICGVLFEKVPDRFSQSGAALHQLIKDHKFNAIVPHDYMEEVASHLIEACRDYRHIIEKDIDLSSSGNAFVSHYSNYRKNFPELSFEKYVEVFGARLKNITSDMSDQQFYSVRNRITSEIANIASKYNFKVETYRVEYFAKNLEFLKDLLEENELTKPEVLVRHDAKVISYLSGNYVSSGIVKILCTWDKIHSMVNPDGNSGYYVMHPIAVIDYLSLANGGDERRSVTHLVDFAAVQEEKDLVLSARIWDSIAKIESENLSDGQLLLSAKEFKYKYMNDHANADDYIPKKIEKSWMAWRK